MPHGFKKIVILGSAPNATWADADIAYCANGAIGFYASELTTVNQTINVVSSRILNKSRIIANGTEDTIYSAKLNAICNASPTKLILIEPFANIGLSAYHASWLRNSGYRSPIEYLEPSTRINWYRQLTGLPYPLPLAATLTHPNLRSLRDTLYLLPYRFGWKKSEPNSRFRPSTGIIALLAAVHEHGHKAKYEIAGISLSQRNLHQNNTTVVTAARKEMEPHIMADRITLRALADRFKITSTNPEIAALLKQAQQ